MCDSRDSFAFFGCDNGCENIEGCEIIEFLSAKFSDGVNLLNEPHGICNLRNKLV